jgi:hypothetical protein
VAARETQRAVSLSVPRFVASVCASTLLGPTNHSNWLERYGVKG